MTALALVLICETVTLLPYLPYATYLPYLTLPDKHK